MNAVVQIRSNQCIVGGRYWYVKTPTTTTHYEHAEGAFTYAQKYLLRHRKEMSAFAMLDSISINLCSVEEADLIKKLKKNKCKGITKSQYGWLKGIYERQVREW
jgi:hypothetical protein